MKKKNPVLQEKYDQGYKDGYEKGFKAGADLAKASTIEFFIGKIKSLEKVPGIGQKTFLKFIHHFGDQYFSFIKNPNNKEKDGDASES